MTTFDWAISHRDEVECFDFFRESPQFIGAYRPAGDAADIGTATFSLGGFFNVAASDPDPAFVNWSLIRCARPRLHGTRSIDRRGGVA